MTRRARRFDFDSVAGKAERLARKILASWLAGGIPADTPEPKLDRAIREDGAGSWELFEGQYRRAPRPAGQVRALEFLKELAGARARLREGDADQSARLAFLAGLAFALVLDDMTGRPRRRKVDDPAALVAAVGRYRRAGGSETAAKEGAADEFGVDARTVERYLRKAK